jgi:hypothetical protein
MTTKTNRLLHSSGQYHPTKQVDFSDSQTIVSIEHLLFGGVLRDGSRKETIIYAEGAVEKLALCIIAVTRLK